MGEWSDCLKSNSCLTVSSVSRLSVGRGRKETEAGWKLMSWNGKSRRRRKKNQRRFVQEMKISLSCSLFLFLKLHILLIFSIHYDCHCSEERNLRPIRKISWLNYLFIDSKSFPHFWHFYDFQVAAAASWVNLVESESTWNIFRFIIIFCVVVWRTQICTLKSREIFIEKFMFFSSRVSNQYEMYL